MAFRKLSILSLLIAGAALHAQPPAAPPSPAEVTRTQLAYTLAHYTKYEYRIPMRDGVRLFAAVYVPKDATAAYPIILMRTPYSIAPYGADNYKAQVGPSFAAEEEGFIFVYEDVRGRYMSEGTFVDVRPHKTHYDGPTDTDESTDTYDTIDWLVKHVPNNNGKAGMWGISYPGFFAAHGLIDSHPALKAVSPQAPMGDVGNGDDGYHNGAFHLAANFRFYSGFLPRKGNDPEPPQPAVGFEPGTMDAYDFFLRMGPVSDANEKYLKHQSVYWDDTIKHDTYDEYWQSRAQAPYMKNVTPAVMWVGGWFDAEDLAGPLKLFDSLEKNGATAPDTLVMGPWRHGGWARDPGDTLGNLSFKSNTSGYFQENIELPFFVQNLKGKGNGLKAAADGSVPKAIVFETGRNEWHRFDAWPPKNGTVRSLYFDEDGKLSWSAPPAVGFDEYSSDPNKPVPSTGEVAPGMGMPADYMTFDQRFAARRPDVLTYETAPLDHDVTIAGPITPVLRVSTSGTDSDFIVKLIDVYPNDYPDPDPNAKGVYMGGYQQLVRGEPFRGKFRNSMSKPEPFTPDRPEKIEFWMPDVLHTFRSGHRIMVQIQSSWFPLVDRNPQKFLDIPNAHPADFQKAMERVYRGGAEGSHLRVLVME
jgi:putative CocE/NonD family hydrolase